ncbi:MAG: amidohydrolase [Firmicutes bacterium]|nr:amidohydrolase [Bacillota bacterium]
MGTLFKNIVILSPKPGSDQDWDLIEQGYVLVEGTKIVAVASGEVPPDLVADEVIDGKGKVLLPGFINLHTHAPMTLLRGLGEDLPLERWLEEKIFPAEDRLEDDDYYWGSLLAIAEMLLSGTTCFFDMYMGIPQMVQAVEESGIRACLARGFVGDEESGRASFNEALSFSREYNGAAQGRVTFTIAPHGTYTCTPGLLKKAAEAAGELGLPIHIHLSETKVENQTVLDRYGKTPTEILAETGLLELPLLAAHGVHLSEQDLDLLAEANAFIAHCPASNMKLASGIANLTAWRERGINVGIGTDGAASNNNLDLYEELRLAGYLQKVSTGDPTKIPAGYLLQRVVHPGATSFGVSAPVGRIEPGFQADLQVVDFEAVNLQPVHDYISNLVYAARGANVEHVMVAGRSVVRKGELTTIDPEELLWQASKRARKLQV